jgi:hypothetical protein
MPEPAYLRNVRGEGFTPSNSGFGLPETFSEIFSKEVKAG